MQSVKTAQLGSASRLEFLKNSAYHLQQESPSTSRHLLSVYNHLLLEESRPLPAAQQRESCPACGNYRNPNAYTTTKRTSGLHKAQKLKVRKKGASTSWSTAMEYKCSTPQCGRYTYQKLQRPPRYMDQRKIRSKDTDTKPTSTVQAAKDLSQLAKVISTPTPKISSDNAGSKKRAKARKQQGLQALLNKQKSQSQTSSPLDLMDFLQS
ncbi:hypothetical protein AJ80_04976 [Polytolypa hystricis UAMH7299]|uniref:Uncharacterized protein n=1 Tax=Polytolypa hystricis (strain UAMH7299) TaxID=1447883 RepID=A0A2B7Y7R9_POLH7|nr:hypothetical protein AJ80_04976 [Polytolypa hystricis UAMH7299]